MTNTIKDASPTMITTDEALHECIRFLNQSSELSLDLEFDKNRLRYGFNLCLMQIYCQDKCFLIDPLSNDLDITNIFPVLENPDIAIIVFAFGEDLKLLLSLGCKPTNIYDLATLSRLMDYPALSLSNLLFEITGKEPTKSSQLSDWFKRPLSPKQVQYAADDVLFLPTIRTYFEAQPRFEMIADWFKEEAAELEKVTFSYEEEEKAFLKKKDKLKMTEYQWHIFVALMKLRNKTAKSFNRPVHFIIPTELVKEIVEKPSLVDQWVNLPRIYKPIKTNGFKQKVAKCIFRADLQARKEDLSKTKCAVPALSVEEKKMMRAQRAEDEKTKKEIFKPIQEELVVKIGANATNYLFSNRVITDVISKSADLLPYRQHLVESISQELGIEIEPYL